MNNENSSNNTDFTSVIKELQNLNNNTDANGKKLDQIIDYMLAKDIQEKSEKEEQLKQEEKAAADYEVKAQEEQAEQDTQTATYTELLTDIRDQSVLTNNILSGQIFFMGVLFGVLLLNVLWNRFIR